MPIAFEISNDERTQSFENQDFVILSFQYQSSFSAILHLFESPDSVVNPRRFLSQKILVIQSRRTIWQYHNHHSS